MTNETTLSEDQRKILIEFADSPACSAELSDALRTLIGSSPRSVYDSLSQGDLFKITIDDDKEYISVRRSDDSQFFSALNSRTGDSVRVSKDRVFADVKSIVRLSVSEDSGEVSGKEKFGEWTIYHTKEALLADGGLRGNSAYSARSRTWLRSYEYFSEDFFPVFWKMESYGGDEVRSAIRAWNGDRIASVNSTRFSFDGDDYLVLETKDDVDYYYDHIAKCDGHDIVDKDGDYQGRHIREQYLPAIGRADGDDVALSTESLVLVRRAGGVI